MNKTKQIFSLVKQELRAASRTRYIVISFIIMPLIMWGLQGGVQLLIGASLTGQTQEGETIYIVNYDEGNLTHNMGDLLVNKINASSHTNGSFLFGANINHTLYANTSESALREMRTDPETASSVLPLIIIPRNFTEVFTNFSIPSNPIPPIVEMYTLPGGIIGTEFLQAGVGMVLSQDPFLQVTIEKSTHLSI